MLKIYAGMIIFMLLIMFFFAVYLTSRFRRCPSDKILVIFGSAIGNNRSAKCIHGGGAFVLPLFQDYSYLSLTPMSINISTQNVLSKDKIKNNISSTFTVAISTDENIMYNAAERLLNLSISEIEDLAKEIIIGNLRLILASFTIEEINQDSENFFETMKENIEQELNKIGLKIINIDINNIKAVDNQ